MRGQETRGRGMQVRAAFEEGSLQKEPRPKIRLQNGADFRSRKQAMGKNVTGETRERAR
jgi:hypothetical protein